jgi:hypothetical protein
MGKPLILCGSLKMAVTTHGLSMQICATTNLLKNNCSLLYFVGSKKMIFVK